MVFVAQEFDGDGIFSNRQKTFYFNRLLENGYTLASAWKPKKVSRAGKKNGTGKMRDGYVVLIYLHSNLIE